MKILIVGGGIAGPALAALLQKSQQHDITLIEQAPKFANIGYAIAIWGNGRSILKKLDIDHHVVEKEGYELPWNVFETTEGKILKTYSMDIFRKYGPTVTISRPILHEALINLLAETKIRLNTTITHLEQKENQTLVTFNDGSHETFDLVVGADGVDSKVRNEVFGKSFTHSYGWTTWICWIPSEFAHPAGALEIAGAGKVYFTYPLQDRAVAVFIATTSPKFGEDKLENLRLAFTEYGGTVEKIINALKSSDDLYSSPVRYIEMKQWVKGRVVVIGDAQHAQSPIIGMGASMALEDAYVLADELNKTANAQEALVKFEKRRQQRVEKFKKASRRLERWMMADGAQAVIRTLGLRFIPNSYFVNPVKQLLETNP